MDSTTPNDRQPEPREATDSTSAPADGAQDLQPLDDLADVEFLLEGIEDKIAPLA